MQFPTIYVVSTQININQRYFPDLEFGKKIARKPNKTVSYFTNWNGIKNTVKKTF